MHPVLIQIGPLVIRWYGVMIALACFAGMWLALKEAKRKGIGREKIEGFFFYALIGAIIGARLYYVAFSCLENFWSNPLTLFAVWEGGLAIHGGILGGLLVALIYARKREIPFWKLADTVAPSLILGQTVGRIGCFLNGDAHGHPTKLPWGMIYSPESPAGRMFPGQPLHPTQLYEMFFNWMIFLFLWKWRKRFKVDGHLFLLYVMMYSAIRIFIEHFRADKLVLLGKLSAAQSIGIIGIIIGLGLIYTIQNKRRKAF